MTLHNCEQCIHRLKTSCEQQINQWSSGLSHQLNTPLGISLTALTSLQHDLINQPSQISLNKMISTLDIVVNNLHDVIEQLSTFNKITQPKADIVSSNNPIKQQLTDIIELVKLRHSHVEPTIVISCPTELAVKSCKTVYSTIWQNLLDNVFEHAFDGNSVAPHVHINISFNKANNTLLLMIKDNGRGIPNPLLEQIPSPYTGTQQNAGRGVGLAEVSHLVENVLHGSMTIKSAGEERGTTIKLAIPLTD